MKKAKLLNSEVSHLIARLGHTQMITIADSGLPIDKDVDRIDLALTYNIPKFLDVLDVVLEELQVEHVILAQEIKEANADIHNALKERFKSITYVSHEQFKEKTKSSEAIIRTGEITPFANIILCSGVVF